MSSLRAEAVGLAVRTKGGISARLVSPGNAFTRRSDAAVPDTQVRRRLSLSLRLCVQEMRSSS
jgi:hypothetical protein